MKVETTKNSKIQDLKLQHYEQLTMQLDRESKDCVLKLCFFEENRENDVADEFSKKNLGVLSISD